MWKQLLQPIIICLEAIALVINYNIFPKREIYTCLQLRKLTKTAIIGDITGKPQIITEHWIHLLMSTQTYHAPVSLQIEFTSLIVIDCRANIIFYTGLLGTRDTTRNISRKDIYLSGWLSPGKCCFEVAAKKADSNTRANFDWKDAVYKSIIMLSNRSGTGHMAAYPHGYRHLLRLGKEKRRKKSH